MPAITPPSPVKGINNPEKIRVLIYANNQFAHVSLSAMTGPLEDRIKALEEKLSEKK